MFCITQGKNHKNHKISFCLLGSHEPKFAWACRFLIVFLKSDRNPRKEGLVQPPLVPLFTH
ncbi:hypothetical protein DD606_25300 [Enterobacter cloacae complex sp. GF14B]|nr:hypothetical protein DD606_25300 [Enterobacter cloacae complex sp. GF14B]